MRQLYLGLSIPEVARAHVSLSTAKTYVASVYDKLEVGDRDQALLAAIELGIIRAQPMRRTGARR